MYKVCELTQQVYMAISIIIWLCSNDLMIMVTHNTHTQLPPENVSYFPPHSKLVSMFWDSLAYDYTYLYKKY